MIKKNVILMILAVLTLTASQVQPMRAQTGNANQSVEKIRLKVQEIGTGEKARVEIKFTNNTKLKGYISSISADTFTIVDTKAGIAQDISYTEVQQVKKSGGISKTKLGIIIGAAAAAVIVGVTVIYPVLCDGGAGC